MAEKKPIEQGLVARAASGLRYILTGRADWFGPGEPLAPAVPDTQRDQVAGRQFDFPVGVNSQAGPRSGEAVSFAQLRGLADSYDLLRLVIETRKDQMSKLRWTIKPRDKKAKPDPRCAKIEAFLQMPDREHTWGEWVRILLEDLFVIDAPTLYPRLTRGGELYALEPVDGATIKRVLDQAGRTPMPPYPAYQQVLKGFPAIDYSRDELIYRPRNPRSNRVYGYSPVEQVVMTVNIALRRQIHQLQYHTEGNISNLIFRVPKEWSSAEIKQFQEWWDSITQGQNKHRGLFVPEGIDPIEIKQPPLKDLYDEWLARVVCFCFSIEPTPFVAQVNRSVAETAREQSLTEGLAPVQGWVRDLINLVIVKWFESPDLEFVWDEEDAVDPLVQAQINQIYVQAKVLHPDEVRAELGHDPLTPEQKAEMATPAPFSLAGFSGDAGGETLATGNAPPAKQDDASPKEALAKAKKSIRPINRDRPDVVKARDKLAAALKGFLADQSSKIAGQISEALALEKSGQGGRDKARRIVDALDLREWEDELPGVTEPWLASIAVSGGAQALDQLDLADSKITGLMRERAQTWASARAAEMVGMKHVDGELVANPDARWQITESTRDLLRGLTESAIDGGWSAQELADQIATGGAFSASRAEMIARTEIANADIAGTMEGYAASGMVTMKEWLTAGDDLVSDECQANADGGPVLLGEAFPSGADAPPNHPNCRCDVVPVLDDEVSLL